MATKMLESSAVSAFCESVAVMHSAGIQMDEAVFLLGENMEDAAFKRACDVVSTTYPKNSSSESPWRSLWTIQDASPPTSSTWWAQASTRAA